MFISLPISMFTAAAIVATLAVSATAKIPSTGSDRVAYDAPDHPPGWVRGGRADPALPMHLYFLLNLQHVGALEQRLLSTSDPASPAYGQHMTNAEVHRLVAPPPAAIRSVQEFLAVHMPARQAVASTPNSDILKAVLTVREVERAFQTEVYRYTHALSGESALKATGYTLPMNVSVHVAAVAPLTMLPSHTARATGSNADAAGTNATTDAGSPTAILNTPKTLRALYGVGKEQGTAGQNKQAVLGFLGQR